MRLRWQAVELDKADFELLWRSADISKDEIEKKLF